MPVPKGTPLGKRPTSKTKLVTIRVDELLYGKLTARAGDRPLAEFVREKLEAIVN